MHPSAQSLVERLGLLPHPEGGFFRETFRSPLTVGGLPHGAPRVASTAIYYLLPAGSFSAFHRVRSDEVWHYYDGDPLELHTLDADGGYAIARLGPEIEQGERPQLVVRAGVLQAARPLGERFTLVGCTVAPGFEFADFEIPSRAALVAQFPEHRDLIVQLTR